MRVSLATHAILPAIAITLLTSCSGASSTPTNPPNFVPQGVARSRAWHGLKAVSLASLYQGSTALARLAVPALQPPPGKCSEHCGFWASEFGANGVLRYGYSGNVPPECSVPGVAYVNDVNSETKNYLFIPDGANYTIDEYYFRHADGKCPQRPRYSIPDGPLSTMPIGQPSDVVPLNGGSTLFVANIVDYVSSPPYYGPGSVSVCSQSKGCTNFTNSAITGYAGGVACCTKSGSVSYCYLSAEGGAPNSPAGVLLYYPSCTGQGEQATGYVNPSTGGLDVDEDGNLAAVSMSDATVYVYGGCPKCQLLFKNPLRGLPVYGHFNTFTDEYVVGDAANGSLDVYEYSPSEGFSYFYSITDGLYASETPEGAAFVGWKYCRSQHCPSRVASR
jgi:hypothetical protein